MNQNTLTKVLKNTIIGGLFIIPFIPLYVANPLFFPFITGKAFAFRFIVEIVFALWLVLIFTKKHYAPRISWTTGMITLFAIVTLVADLLGVSPMKSLWSNFERMEGWVLIAHIWAYFMVMTSVVDTKKLWNNFFNISLLASAIAAVYGLSQYFAAILSHNSGVRVDVFLGNAAYMAVYMLFHVGIAGYMYFVARKGEIANANILKWIYPILGILYSFVIFETQTRGTVFGLIGGIMSALTIYAIFAKKNSGKSRIISGSIIAIIILGGIVFWANRDSAFIKSVPTLNRIATISLTDVKSQARSYIWPMAIKGFTEKPVLGWGQENFNYIFNANYNPIMYNQEQWFDRAHSVFIDWLVASGIVGLLVYLSLYFFAIMSIVKSDLSVAKKSVLIGLIVGYTVHNIFVFDNISSYIMFFAILAFTNSFREGKYFKHFGPHSKATGKDVVEYVVAPTVIVLFLIVTYFVNVKPLIQNLDLITALQSCGSVQTIDESLFQKIFDNKVFLGTQESREQLLACAGQVIASNQIQGSTKQAFFSIAQKEINAQIKETPNDARIYVLAGSFYNSIGASKLSLPILETAYKLSPKKQSIALQLASAYDSEGQKDKAESILKDSYEYETSNTEAKQAYIVVLISNGKEADARKMFGNDTALFENARVASVYMSLKQYDKAIALYKKLAAANLTDVNVRATVAQAQSTAGQKWSAIETVKAMQKDFADKPEYKDSLDKFLKQIQDAK